MSNHILRCVKCRAYTLEEIHCGENTITTRPAKYSSEDKYASYRREAKQEQFEKEGLL